MIELFELADDVLLGVGALLILFTGDLAVGGVLIVIGAALHALMHGMV